MAEDAIRDVLTRLVEGPLPAGVQDHLVTAVHRRAIDRMRAAQRRG